MPQVLLNKKHILVFILLWVLLWLIVHALVLISSGISYPFSLLDSIISNSLLGLLCYASVNVLSYYQWGKNGFLFSLALSLMLALLHLWSAEFILKQVLDHPGSYFNWYTTTLPVRFAFSFLMLIFISLLSWVWNYVKEQENDKSRKDEAERLLREAELSNLRQQLQPHFLFNSLNSISALVGFKPDEARKMIQHLSDFLRGTLKKDDTKMISLEEEIKHLKLYLEIEKVRFGHRLSTNILFEEEDLKLKLPSLLLQPLVENAIKFGLYDTTGEIAITIKIKSVPSFLLLEIQNPYDAATAKSRKGEGFGLKSVQRRLFLLFARQDLLATEVTETHFIAKVKIPQ